MTTTFTDLDLLSETDAVAVALRAQRGDDFAPAWECLRATSLPFLPILLRDDLPRAHRLCAQALHALGRVNIGFAYAVENHLMVLGGMETYVARHPDPELRARLDEAARERWLTANTRAFVHSDRAHTEGVTARRRGDSFELEGAGSFVSLARAADLLLLLLEGEEPLALWFSPRATAGIQFGGYSFPHLMLASDTRALKCSGAKVPVQSALRVPPEHLGSAGPLSLALMAWHLTLTVAQFLGGASALADKTVEFTRNFRSFDNRPLARLDGVLSELGQIGARLGTGEALLADFAGRLGRIHEPADDAAEVLPELAARAQIANCAAMELTEEVSRRCRRILGTRIFGPSAEELERLATELLVGPLIPRTNSLLERDIGAAMVGGRLAWHG